MVFSTNSRWAHFVILGRGNQKQNKIETLTFSLTRTPKGPPPTTKQTFSLTHLLHTQPPAPPKPFFSSHGQHPPPLHAGDLLSPSLSSSPVGVNSGVHHGGFVHHSGALSSTRASAARPHTRSVRSSQPSTAPATDQSTDPTAAQPHPLN